MVKPDAWIRRMALERGMIEPFSEGMSRPGIISYGLSSYGYDFRVSREFKVFSMASQHMQDTCRGPLGHPNMCDAHGEDPASGPIDPKTMTSECFRDVSCEVFVMDPHSYVLARSVEYFRIPREIITVTYGKSTYARCGIIVNVTPFEPEWEGFVTISITNTNPFPAKLYAGEGIAQVLFLGADGECEVSYADKKGKYQMQHQITVAKIDGK
jgi:dCTP deaminase